MKEAILVVEDDPAIARGLEKNLRFEGYTVHVAGDGQRGLELAVDKRPDLILLDVMLPEMNGFAVLRELRRLEVDTPVIMLTAKGEERDKVRGLEMGADDYVTKPFGLAELLARIEAVLRRQRRLDRATEQVGFDDVEIDFSSHAVRVAGRPVEMTIRELELLRFFLQQEGRVLSRQEILNHVWGFDYFGTERTVDNFVNRLRQKLEPEPARPRYFQTVRGAGYRFQRGPQE